MSDVLDEMLQYVRGKVTRSRQPLDYDTPLFSSGLIDSLAFVDVLLHLEDVSGVRIPTGRVRPADIDSVRKMVQALARFQS